jgi:centrosomal CEP192-like protein/beta-propeller repeat-containing protein
MANCLSDRARARLPIPSLLFVAFVIVLALVDGIGWGGPKLPARAFNGKTPSMTRSARMSDYALVENYGELPLRFEPNLGQAGERVRFVARGDDFALFLTPRQVVLSLDVPGAATPQARRAEQHPETLRLRSGSTHKSAVLQLALLNGNANAEVSGVDRLPSVSNYFTGNKPTAWHVGIPNYAKVRYEGIYPGVDLVFYGNRRAVECDFVVAPGSDPRRIRFQIKGSENTKMGPDGRIVITKSATHVHLEPPYIYQDKNGVRETVLGSYYLAKKQEVGIRLGRYDTSRPLVIDPVLSYSTFLGGAGGAGAFSVFVDSQGNAYVTGSAQADFPTTPGVVKPVFGGGGQFNTNAFVSKLNPSGNSLVYSTYLGGTPGQDSAFSVFADSQGNAYVVGDTASSDFPTVNAFQSTLKSASGNAFVTKLNPTGTALLYSTYLGGSTGADVAYGVSIDALGEAYVTGAAGSTDFPLLNPLQTNGSTFVTKLSSAGSALVYSTRLGGSGADNASAIATDSAGDAYIAGSTSSQDFPTTPGSVQPALKGSQNAFFTEINPSGNGLVYSTFLGASGLTASWANGLALDGNGSVFLTGWTIASYTTASDFPTTPGVIESTLPAGDGAAFVSKITPAGKGIADLTYSTFLGATSRSGAISQGNGIVVDKDGNAVVTGRTGSANFPTTPGTFQSTLRASQGNFNAFVSKLNPSATQLLYSTYLGGSVADQALGIGADQRGNVYVVGQSLSPDFPTTAGAFQPNHLAPSGAGDAFVAKFAVSSVIAVTPVSLDFGQQLLNQTSQSQVATITNNSSADLSFSAPPSLSGPTASEFALVSACGATLAANTSCNVSLSFTPTVLGAASATLSFFDGDPSSPQTVPLTGVGIVDFSISAPASETVTVGSSVGIPVTVTPLGGSTQTVNLDCQGAPSNSTCSVSPPMVTLDGAHAASATVMVQTKTGMLPGTPSLQGPRDLSYCVLLCLLSLATIGVFMKARQRRLHLVFGVALIACIVFVGCGGGSGGTGTPKGTFTVVITGVSGSQSHSVNVSLTVH